MRYAIQGNGLPLIVETEMSATELKEHLNQLNLGNIEIGILLEIPH